jgi:hypothetical protein
MTEAEWLASTDTHLMLDFVASKASERKLRLLVVACCRHLGHLLAPAKDCRDVAATQLNPIVSEPDDKQARGALLRVLARRFGQSSWAAISDTDKEQMTQWWGIGRDDASQVPASEVEYDFIEEVMTLIGEAVSVAVEAAQDRIEDKEWARAENSGGAADAVMTAYGKIATKVADEEQLAQCQMLRDLFGNPFRSVALAPVWLTSRVVALAQAIHDERAFDRLPVLADALEEAGCHDEHILGHCRGPGPHVRGCWLVDLILGKQ